MKPTSNQHWSKLRRGSIQRLSSATVGTGSALSQSNVKGELEELKLRIEILRLICVSFAVSVGILSLFFYCFFAARFIPSGVTAGDTLLFIFLTLAIGFIGLLISGMGSLLWMPFVAPAKELSAGPGANSELRGRRNRLMYAAFVYFLVACAAGLLIFNASLPRTRQFTWLPGDLSVVGILLLFALVSAASAGVFLVRKVSAWEALMYAAGPASAVLLGALLAPLPDGNAIIISAMWGGMVLAIAFGKPTDFSALETKQPRSQPVNGTSVVMRSAVLRRAVTCALAVVLPPLLISLYGPDNSKIGMPSLVFGTFGLFSSDAAIAVSADNLQTLTAAAELTGDQLQMCRGPGGTAIITGVNVWWHGVGIRSLVELPLLRPARGRSSGARVELDTSGVKLIRDYGTHCIEVPEFAFFRSGEGKGMSEDGRQALVAALESAMTHGQLGQKLLAIEVIGHADPMPPANSTTNEELAKVRAEEVARELRLLPSLNTFFTRHATVGDKGLRVITFGSRRPVQTCKVEGSLAAQRECNSVNRRVEIKLRFGIDRAEKVDAGTSGPG